MATGRSSEMAPGLNPWAAAESAADHKQTSGRAKPSPLQRRRNADQDGLFNISRAKIRPLVNAQPALCLTLVTARLLLGGILAACFAASWGFAAA